MDTVDLIATPDPEPSASAGPVLASERIVSLDVLRGVAVLGILVMNIYGFAMPFIAYANPLAMGGTELHNIGTWFFTHIIFDQKFLSIFAMLFGAGLVLMTGRAEARDAKYGRIFYRRQFWLLILGAVHGYLIWFGDILFMYAVIGMMVFLFRNRQPRTLIIIACLLLPIALFMSYGMSEYVKKTQAEVIELTALQEAGEVLTEEQEKTLKDWEETRAFMAPTDEDLRKDIEAYSGTYLDIVAHRAPIVFSMQVFTTLFYGISRVAALMLIGMALMKLGVLTGERPSAFYRNLMLGGYLIGLPLTVFSAFNLYAHDFDQQYVIRVGGIANYIGSLIVAFGHIGLVMLLVQSGAIKRVLQKFAAVGRMALTNYLMHSVILTTLFYGYGLGLYGEIPRFWQMGFVIGVILLQMIISSWWLSRYRFGPVEWLWRSLTYWRRQPMRSNAIVQT
ncbi:MAG: DUF418 domain-containing protein [Woeseiaceae bacterium]|nr:DUF418 domain-containing protein [Woeseiaceae bacterium]